LLGDEVSLKVEDAPPTTEAAEPEPTEQVGIVESEPVEEIQVIEL
jgi:hypothetical protein